MLGVSAVKKGATEVQILYESSDGLAKSNLMEQAGAKEKLAA